MSGRLDLTVRGGSFRGVHDGRLRLDSALNDGWLRVSTLELNALRSHVAITGAAVRWSNVLTGRTGRLLGELTAEFSLSSEDFPSLLSLAGVPEASAVARIPNHRMVLAGRVADGRLVIPAAELISGAGSIRLRDLQTSLPPAGADTPLTADLRMQAVWPTPQGGCGSPPSN